jgi:hypothetical protein
MSDIKVRVGQQNAIKVVSSISGSSGGFASLAENVIGGIASVTSLNVSGISTFVGVSTFNNDVYIDGDLYVRDDLVFDEFTARNATVTGITTVNFLTVTGVSTFVGISTFNNDVYVGGDLYVRDDLVFDEFTARNATVTGIVTISEGLYYGPYYTSGVAYFNSDGLMVSTGSTDFSIDYTNYILTTDNA